MMMKKWTPHTHKSHASQAGFSLIELAIGVAIIGLLASAFIQLYDIYRTERANVEERVTQEKITSAMAVYLQKNGRYPCPARLDLRPQDANFGKAAATCNTTLVAQGALPVFDLNLPFEMIGDGYQNKLLYAVTGTKTNTATFNTGANEIQIRGRGRDASNTIVDTDKTAPFIVISHGPDMKGAYRVDGTTVTVACGSAAADSENCDGDVAFRDLPYAPLNNVNNANHFDDSVIYSLVQKETTLWVITPDDSGVNIVSRNTGNIGIGVDNPDAKLSVRGGNLNVDAGGASASGDIITRGTIEAQTNATIRGDRVEAERNIITKDAAEAGEVIRAGRFCYNIDISACN